eukprot:Skav210492  [mRNA]  locus=scaffold601:58815:63202:+ [translate_table: standard]
MDPTYKRRRSLPSPESSAEYLRLVCRFAHLQGLCLPTSAPVQNTGGMPANDFQFHGLTGDQTMFLSFLEALVVRFTQLFRPCVVPILAGTDAILSHPSWSVRKIGQWCQFVDRSSLIAIDRCQGLPDHKDQLTSALASVTLGSCPKLAATMLPLKCSGRFAQDLQSKLSAVLPEDINPCAAWRRLCRRARTKVEMKLTGGSSAGRKKTHRVCSSCHWCPATRRNRAESERADHPSGVSWLQLSAMQVDAMRQLSNYKIQADRQVREVSWEVTRKDPAELGSPGLFF